MKNNFMKTLIITTIICLLPMILSAILYDDLPEQIGKPDDYLPKAFVCYGLPALFALLNVGVCIGMNADKRKANQTHQANKLKIIVQWMFAIMTITLLPITLFNALGKNIPIQIAISLLIGVAFIILGNYMPKRHNCTIGLKLPLTLKSEENWNKTHRLAGFLWILSGLIIIIFGLILNFEAIRNLIILIIILLILIPIAYSFYLYKRGLTSVA